MSDQDEIDVTRQRWSLDLMGADTGGPLQHDLLAFCLDLVGASGKAGATQKRPQVCVYLRD